MYYIEHLWPCVLCKHRTCPHHFNKIWTHTKLFSFHYCLLKCMYHLVRLSRHVHICMCKGYPFYPPFPRFFLFELEFLQTLWYLFQFHSIFYFIHFSGIYTFEDIYLFYSVYLYYNIRLHLCIVVLQRLTKWHTFQIPMVIY